jgi:5-methylcytosine-specific restriction endonuclease McrA
MASPPILCDARDIRSLWLRAHITSAGAPAGILFQTAYLDSVQTDDVAVFSLTEGEEFPKHLKAPFTRLFLPNALCGMCGGQPTGLPLRRVRLHNSSRKGEWCVVCACGNPVWRISFGSCGDIQQAILRADYVRRRKENLREAGGKHTSEEIQEILRLQEHRCIYCNSPFTPERRPTRDHLLSITHGGGDWALNIVLACRRCNSRRGTIPFRNYCRLLSPRQNRRVLLHLGRRLAALEIDRFPEDAFTCFCTALRSNHATYRYKDICRMSAAARRNAAINRLLPCSPATILGSHYAQRSRSPRP